MTATQLIREKFFSGYREAEFIVVCDVLKENSQVVKELNNAQVHLIDINDFIVYVNLCRDYKSFTNFLSIR